MFTALTTIHVTVIVLGFLFIKIELVSTFTSHNVGGGVFACATLKLDCFARIH